ncbi:MAG TPA: HNH endonuclease, partial [Anaeromyxobacteraceae bacterium]|nr:HNH endonuclease [Anaeromyxobacteraceae bacterium]
METRDLAHRLADLLRREHAALADFLLAVAQFDRERRWLELGYTSLFYFLHRELGLSKGAAFYRKTAAELVQRYPEIVEPLRQGRLCLTSVVALAKVITPENRGEVLPRFFHASKQDALAIVAELKPDAAPPRREVVTAVSTRTATVPALLAHVPRTDAASSELVHPANLAASVASDPDVPAPPAPDLDRVEPLTADLRRYHI